MAGPGAHAQHLATLAVARQAAYAIPGALALVAGAARYGTTGLDVITVAGLGIGAAALAVASRAGTQARKAGAGARSERRVAHVLERCGARHVLHGLDLGSGGDADHIVLGPVAAVVETKTGTGPVAIAADGALTVAGRAVPGNPCRQARRQAAAAARHVGVRVDAVVCVTDMSGTARRSSTGEWVCSLAQLPGVLRELPSRLDTGRADNAVMALRAAGAR